MSDSPDLKALLEAAHRLPVCDGAAKLHALVSRVVEAARSRADVGTALDRLAEAATASLEDDPWMQFEKTARALQTQMATAPLEPA